MAPESGPLTMRYTDLMLTSQTPKAVGQRRVHRLVSTMKSHRLCPISNQEAIMPAHQSTPEYIMALGREIKEGDHVKGFGEVTRVDDSFSHTLIFSGDHKSVVIKENGFYNVSFSEERRLQLTDCG